MPSSVTFAPAATATKATQQSIYTRPAKKQKMSITQTYFLAHSARGKLSREASRPDHDLRLLVGHANMLDSLMLDLANAEQEQERWFNNIVIGSSAQEQESTQQKVETIQEESEDEEEEQDTEIVTAVEVDSDMEDDSEDETDGELRLVRTASRHSPPELTLDTDSSSDSEEDDHMIMMPPTPNPVVLTEKQRQAIATTSFYDAKQSSNSSSLSPAESEALEQEGFYLPSRQQPTIIAAY